MRPFWNLLFIYKIQPNIRSQRALKENPGRNSERTRMSRRGLRLETSFETSNLSWDLEPSENPSYTSILSSQNKKFGKICRNFILISKTTWISLMRAGLKPPLRTDTLSQTWKHLENYIYSSKLTSEFQEVEKFIENLARSCKISDRSEDPWRSLRRII